MLGIPLGLVYANANEWLPHKYVLHTRGRRSARSRLLDRRRRVDGRALLDRVHRRGGGALDDRRRHPRPRRGARLALGARTLVALALLSACGPERPRPPPAVDDPIVEAPATDPTPTCELGPLSTLLVLTRARGGLAMHEGWLAALDDVLTVRSPDGERSEVRDGHARRLLAVGGLGGRAIVLAEGSCEDSAHCLIAIDPGSERDPLTTALPGPIQTSRRAFTDDAFFIAWSAAGGTRGVERWTRNGADLSHESLPLGDEEASSETPTEILAMTARGSSFFVVWRRGAAEDARSHVFLTSESTHAASEVLHDALTIESIALGDDGLALVAGFEFSRPGFVHFGEGEPLIVPLPVGVAAPEPIGERVRAELDIDDRGLWLRRRSAAGDAVGEPSLVVAGPVEMATVERRTDAFFVAWATPDHRIVGRAARCAN